jgi:hypothetical protein
LQFLELLSDEFIAVVVTYFGRSWVLMKPTCIELECTVYGVCCEDKCKITPISANVKHWVDVNVIFDFSCQHVTLDTDCPGSWAVHMYLFEVFCCGVRVLVGNVYIDSLVCQQLCGIDIHHKI